MRYVKKHFFLLSLLFAGSLSAQSFLNLDFEEVENGMPKMWTKVLDIGYEISVDTTRGFMSSKSLFITPSPNVRRPQMGKAGSVFPVEAAKGKKVVFSGFVKTEDVETGWASLWIEIYGKDANGEEKIIYADMMAGRGAKYTADWKKLSLTVKVPTIATQIKYGVLLISSGKAWFDFLDFEIDGKVYEDVIPPAKK